MPSLLVHFAVSGMIAGMLLGDVFDRRSLAVVLGVTAVPDLDSFIAIWSEVGHRAALHNVFVALIPGALLAVDLFWREESWFRQRFGARGIRIAWVSLLCLLLSSIAFDLVTGVANPFWPVHDQFYTVDGKIELTTREGLVQTFVDLSPPESGGGGGGGGETKAVGTTEEVELSTGVNPADTGTDRPPNRVFPIVRSGWQLVVLLVGTAATALRFRTSQAVDAE